jgi:hypothetical protein
LIKVLRTWDERSNCFDDPKSRRSRVEIEEQAVFAVV